jgi:hypothetical protein
MVCQFRLTHVQCNRLRPLHVLHVSVYAEIHLTYVSTKFYKVLCTILYWRSFRWSQQRQKHVQYV